MNTSDLEVVRYLPPEGENNAGISLFCDNITGRLLVEKRFQLYDIWNGRAKREVEILTQLRGHPNINSIEGHDLLDSTVEETKGSVWLEYCNQGSLAAWINGCAETGDELPERFIWHVFSQLAEAVRYCQYGYHSVEWDPIFHLDITPTNVFLHVDAANEHRYPRVLLGDFGCSVTLSSQMKNAETLRQDPEADVPIPFVCDWQNREFAASESPEFNFHSDVYQIGLVVYCMLARETSIEDVDPEVQLWAETSYSRDLLELVSVCLDRNPDSRPSIMALVERIAPYLRGL